MVKSCFKCGKNNEQDKDIKLFTIPIKNKSSEWHLEFIKHLGVEEIEENEVDVCSGHFKPEDLEVKGHMWTFKENALPVKNEVEVEEEIIIKPEVVYLKYDDSPSNSNEAKQLASLEPLVEYVYEDGDGEIQQPDVNIDEEEIDKPQIDKVEYSSEGNEAQEISIVDAEGGNLEMQPIMPFFLTSSPMFTILNENNEPGETIILQIDTPTEEKKPNVSTYELEELQRSLCITNPGTIVGEYTCDICDNSYGCLNCLKSHYGTFHIAGTLTRYKCKHSDHLSKSTVCPVCDLMFLTRSETMDHYITHSVACDICGSGFDRQPHLRDHYRTSHPGTSLEIVHECELCKASYQYSAGLAKHYQNFHRMVLCPVCKLRFVNVNELQDHDSVHREKLNVLPFACSKCDKAFPKISDIVVHIRENHKREPVRARPRLKIIKVESVKVEDEVKNIKMPPHKKIKVKK